MARWGWALNGGVRDYERWHDEYDDPGSDLSWRLRTVQGYLTTALDHTPGAVRILSLCAGEGRDVIQVLRGRADAERIHALLVELNPAIAETARRAAEGLNVEVRAADAADPRQWADAVPADIVFLVGIFGNIPVEDIRETVSASPMLCEPGAHLFWSRGLHDHEDLNDDIRRWFRESGFTELAYDEFGQVDSPALGALRYDGPAVPLDEDKHLFTFTR